MIVSETTNDLRVLHVHAGNLYGGVEAMLLTQVRQRDLCPALENSFALCFAGRFSEELVAAGATVHWLGNVRVRQPFSIRRVRRNLRDLLRREVFDVVVVHSAWSRAIFGTVVRSFEIPLVFWLHDVPDAMPWPERWARWSRPPELVVCNSNYTADRLPKLYPQVQSKVVYCPVAPPAAYSSDDLKKLRDEFQTPEDAVVILQISRLEPHKGQMAHLEALALLCDLPGWVCWQVGSVQKAEERQYSERIQAAAIRLGIKDRIRFLGWQTDAHKLMAASDIYCQPNLYPEPFGITFVEALYQQKPVVATLLGGPREIVDDSCGFLVSPNDALQLAKTLRKLIGNRELRTQLGAAGPQRAQTLCDPGRQMRHLHEAFLSLARNGLN